MTALVPVRQRPPFERRDLQDLARALELLEYPGFAARLADFAGQPLAKITNRLPGFASRRIRDIVTAALLKSLEAAINTMDTAPGTRSPLWLSQAAAGLTGAAGGVLGVASLAVELPLTTTLMLRAIADIARAEGEDLGDPRARLACLEVFALGSRELNSDVNMHYYASRALVAQTINEAAVYLLEKGIADSAAPVLMRLVAALATRFGLVVSEKVAAVAVPAVGALGGAAVNVVFMGHFQQMAQGHFIMRRLERVYGPVAVEAVYLGALHRLREELKPHPVFHP